MITTEGLSVQTGIAIGKILVWIKKPLLIESETVSDPAAEWEAFLKARDESVADLEQMEQDAREKVGEEKSMIFSVHAMLLQDADFEDAVKDGIEKDHFNASYAVHRAVQELAAFFASMEDNSYMNERAADFKDVSMRVIRKLQNVTEEISLPDGPVILFAEDLTPAETTGLDTSRILAFVTVKGSVNSHTAILARSLGITTIVDTGIELSESYNDKTGIVDGIEGRFLIEPDAETLRNMQDRKEQYDRRQEEMKQMIGKETVTKSGRRISLYANIGNVEDAKRALAFDAEGIGLFRSEFLYLNRTDYPTEEEQFESYKEVAQLMDGKEVIIRTLDIGADKQADYFHLEKEENPAMGLRAIRLCLVRPEIFKTQLRALFRASAFGKINIMFPMITSVEGVDAIMRIVDEVKKELAEKGLKIGTPKLGIMIETPAAAMISDLLAPKVDFFSIGTNDLTQYTLAMDRQNAALKDFLNTHHTAVLRAIEMTAKNAHDNGIPVGICGELASDPDLTEYFIKIGIDELSVSAPGILSLRSRIRALD
ncbi:MAG: phosphoenolpyruvate--protein phosphotransferase [Lachnospiraceae bacterium]|nr:phosphoenolpyruvate--protein phosphotransferase [Lachnospiraceae bacterium]